MNKIIKLCMLLLFLLPEISFAWGFTGHVVIAQIAYNNLTPTAKQQADQLANIIYKHLPPEEQNKLDSHYSNASTFAKIAVLPDLWRKESLGEIFIQNGALPPTSLLIYSMTPTRGFHFLNLPYPQSSGCVDANLFNVVWAINHLESSFGSSNNDNTRAVLMDLEEHYIGDIHQPLHTISKVDSSCTNDEGGNEFCIRWSRDGDRCSKSLHSLWDSGVGYLHNNENVQSDAYELQQEYPINDLNIELKDSNPQDWATANYKYADFIYSLQEGERVPPSYYQQGQQVAKKQMALAGYRLAQVLNNQLSADN